MPPKLIRVTTEAPVATVTVFEQPSQVRFTTTAPAPQQVEVTETERVVIDHPGTQGPPGPAGTSGESAYQLAVDAGFVGTETEWLASLIGPTGPAGPSGGSVAIGGTYVHDQVSADTTWLVNHGLGFMPNVTVVDSANTRIEGELVYHGLNSLEVQFSVPIGGRAYLS